MKSVHRTRCIASALFATLVYVWNGHLASPKVIVLCLILWVVGWLTLEIVPMIRWIESDDE